MLYTKEKRLDKAWNIHKIYIIHSTKSKSTDYHEAKRDRDIWPILGNCPFTKKPPQQQ